MISDFFLLKIASLKYAQSLLGYLNGLVLWYYVTHLPLVPELRIIGAIPLLRLTGSALPFFPFNVITDF